MGLMERDVATNLLTSLSSSFQTAPNFWLSPQNGVSYPIAVQTPQYKMNSLDAIGTIPVSTGYAQPNQLLENIAKPARGVEPAVVSHYNVRPVIDIYSSVNGRDLGSVARAVDKLTAGVKLPRGSSIVTRGQVATMRSSFVGLFAGLGFAIALVYLLIVVNFQSWLDALIIIAALPGALAGICWCLFLSQTTLSVPALMGAIMSIGVATSNSVLVITFANERLPVGTDPNFESERISLLSAQSNDSVWIGFSGGGLSVYRNDAFHEWLQSTALNTGTLYDVYVENPNLIWLAADNGLYALRGTSVISWRAKNGLPGNRILWLQPDGNDWFWLGFSTGIARVRRSDLNASERAGRKVTCDFFDFEDGLLANPIRLSQAAVSQDREHRLWVTTSAGMAIIDPRHIERNSIPPSVLIRHVLANSREMPVASTMQFPPGTRNLEIDYAGLSLAVPQNVRFRYHLEGYDKNWQDADNRRQAFYTNLQPGPYPAAALGGRCPDHRSEYFQMERRSMNV